MLTFLGDLGACLLITAVVMMPLIIIGALMEWAGRVK